jgi:signal transduction histidine kinase
MAHTGRQSTVRRELARTVVAAVSVVALLLSLAVGVLLSAALDGIAGARTNQLAARIEAEAERLATDTDRLLRIAGGWLALDGTALDHRSLNHRFMPVLAGYPQYAAMLIAGADGSEWMLFHKTDGSWLNRLIDPREGKGTHRFLHWKDADSLERDERLPSDYAPTERPWFRRAAQEPPGKTVWTEIYRFHTTKEPGVTAAHRLAAASPGKDLVLALDLRLADIARNLDSRLVGERGLAALLSNEGRILALTGPQGDQGRARREDLVFRPVLGVEQGPLQRGVDLWLSRGDEGLDDRLILQGGEPWRVAFRRLDLGTEPLWLAVFLPVSELIPGLRGYLLAFAVLLAAAVAAVLVLARRTARRISLPLEELAGQTRRVGDMDFAPGAPVRSTVREVEQLARSQDRLRARVGEAYEALLHRHHALEAARERVVEAAEADSAGRLAAGVVRELAPPLAVVREGLARLQGQAHRPETGRPALADIEQALDRAGGVIEGLVELSREGPLDLEPGDLNEVIGSALRRVGDELERRGIRTDTHLAADLPRLPLDRKRLGEVFVHLFTSAARAMGQRGFLSVSTARRVLTPHSGADRDRSGLFEPGEAAVWVEVCDSGPLLDEGDLERLFDPFATTGRAGAGSGLGLAVARTVVRLHRGSVDVRNRSRGGVSVLLLFKAPASVTQAAAAAGGG